MKANPVVDIASLPEVWQPLSLDSIDPCPQETYNFMLEVKEDYKKILVNRFVLWNISYKRLLR
jgi:hypothetical protein